MPEPELLGPLQAEVDKTVWPPVVHETLEINGSAFARAEMPRKVKSSTRKVCLILLVLIEVPHLRMFGQTPTDPDDHPLTDGRAVGADGSVGVHETGVYEDGDTSPVFNRSQVANGAFTSYYAWNGPAPITYNPTPVPPAGGLFSPNITGENSNWFAWWLIAYSEGTIAGLQAQMGIQPAAPGFPGSWGINW